MAGKSEDMIGLVAGLAAASVAKSVAGKVWELSSGGKPAPKDPTEPETTLAEIMVWSILSSVLVSVFRVAIARRLGRGERREKRVQGASGRSREA